jgi:CYTH domain-containing protein
MYQEIERKFLVDVKDIPNLTNRSYLDITQGYLRNLDCDYIYRLRQVLYANPNRQVMGDKYYQTIKGSGRKIRDEYEIELFKHQFSYMWTLCEKESLHKHRYILTDGDISIVQYGVKEIALDVYKNNLEGLFTVEVEFENEINCDLYIPEPWFGKEVTEDDRYSNFNLCLNGNPE